MDPSPPDVPLTRATTILLPPTPHTPSFSLTSSNKSYKHQYANIYFVRLRLLRGVVEERARARWANVQGSPVLVPRVLDVIKTKLCWIVGTVYMDMPLKPNVLEDIARDRSLPAPAPPSKIYSQEDTVMLEDESGRLVLIGEKVQKARLVTGVIIAALGVETSSGEFEVVDICEAGLAPQPWLVDEVVGEAEDGMDVDGEGGDVGDEWIALTSGLNVGEASEADAQIQMLVEYLTGEAGGLEDQASSSRISRLIIAGNSLSAAVSTPSGSNGVEVGERKPRRYGYDATTFSAHPTENLSSTLHDIAQVMPIHILPGENDPSGTILPQQSFPRAMFGSASSFSSFSCETNPTYLRLSTGHDSEADAGVASTSSSRPRTYTWSILANSGQPLNDMFKYLPSPPTTRLSLVESTLRWRHMAPTAPDTVWCHPYFTTDPFVINETPDLYIIGNQPRFQTKMVSEKGKGGIGEGGKGKGKGKRCRVVLVPGFAETGVLVLVNLRTLGVKSVRFAVEGMNAGGDEGDMDASVAVS
ncbi:hypothetical protein JAAARDRAFT_174842 [Jaapia argillacea MUCL 33604]|uniref:DNA-directed DNA polymerase n=1 Tax=Jaapia argillacea MUCL 33604 TaxID=933084 RepID=A0A067QA85_9AGAM|nr:hypothetical protein JAAARDRAFT_174842 [Jaapia argillacea MUCL 33604]